MKSITDKELCCLKNTSISHSYDAPFLVSCVSEDIGFWFHVWLSLSQMRVIC